jgi:cyclase
MAPPDRPARDLCAPRRSGAQRVGYNDAIRFRGLAMTSAASAARRRGAWIAIPLLGLVTLGAKAQSEAPIHYEHLAGPVYYVTGGWGANVTLSAGPDGVLVVDSKNARGARDIIEIAESLSDAPIRYLVNGHEHPDHTDGNEIFAAAGATIIAHESVREILQAGQRGGPPAPAAALPVITFPARSGVNLTFNGETIEIFHVDPAHAPGNSIVHYTGSNVMHVGDLFGPERYPVIAGGTYDAFIDALNIAVRRSNVDTIVVSGVGPLSDREGLIAYREMLIDVRDKVIAALDAGRSLEEFIASKPTLAYDAQYGDPGHALFLPVLYQQMSARRP